MLCKGYGSCEAPGALGNEKTMKKANQEMTKETVITRSNLKAIKVARFENTLV